MFRRNRPRPVYAPKPRVSSGMPLSLWERHLERGLDAFQKGKYDEALADLDEAILHFTRNGELYATRGLILAEMGKADAAREDLAYALQLDDRQWVAHYVSGLLAYRAKQYDEAIEHLSKAQRYAPLRPEIFFTRGIAFYAKGDVNRARLDIDSAVQVLKQDDKRYKSAKTFLGRLEKEVKGKK